MVRILLNFLLLFFILSSFSFAKNDNRMLSRLESDYGPELTHTPYFIRYAFQKAFDIPWDKSYYYQRKEFLIYYQTQVDADTAKEKADAKAEADKEKERLRDEKEALRTQKERLREEQEEQKAEQKEYDDRQRAFDQSVAGQQKEIQQMQRDASQGN